MIEFHKYRTLKSLALEGNAELIYFAIQHGIVGP
jgi:hypothetical protein